MTGQPLDPHWCEDCQSDHGLDLAFGQRASSEVQRLTHELAMAIDNERTRAHREIWLLKTIKSLRSGDSE